MIRFREPEGALLNTLRVFTAPSRVILLLLALLVLTACSGGSQESWAGVSLDPNTNAIYLSHGKSVVAIDPTSGVVRWEYKPQDAASFFAVPVTDDGTVYVGDYKGRLHAISADDGQPRWVYEPEKEILIGPLSPTADDRVIGGVAVDSGLVYFGLGSRNVVAVSRETAQKVWTFETDHGVWAKPLYVPADSEDEGSRATLYVVSLDHHLYALDPATGAKLWSKDLGAAVPGDMVYDGTRHRVYVGTFASELLAVDLTSQEIVARYEADGWLWGRPAFQDDTLYFGDLSGNLYAVRATEEGFTQVWKQAVADGPIRATPILTDGLVIIGSKDKHIYAVQKADGSSAWNANTKGEALTELAFVAGVPEAEDNPDRVVAGTNTGDQRIVAYRVDSGAEVWHYSD